MEEKIVFCKGGGCTAKLGAGILQRVLDRLPRGPLDRDLLVGFDSKDDAAVYRVTDDIAIVQTLDFFPPMVDDPYTFGRIAAANALSDVYAMGGEVKTALNIVCFPEKMDLNVLGEIMRGGSEKVIEAGGTLAGGHSIADSDVKYGLSVTGIVHPDRIYHNNGGRAGDFVLAPGSYNYAKKLAYQTYDVTEYLREGENEIRIWLGDGWFRGRLGFDGGYTNLYGDRCYAIAEGTSLYDGPRYL